MADPEKEKRIQGMQIKSAKLRKAISDNDNMPSPRPSSSQDHNKSNMEKARANANAAYNYAKERGGKEYADSDDYKQHSKNNSGWSDYQKATTDSTFKARGKLDLANEERRMKSSGEYAYPVDPSVYKPKKTNSVGKATVKPKKSNKDFTMQDHYDAAKEMKESRIFEDSDEFAPSKSKFHTPERSKTYRDIANKRYNHLVSKSKNGIVDADAWRNLTEGKNHPEGKRPEAKGVDDYMRRVQDSTYVNRTFEDAQRELSRKKGKRK